MRWTKLAVAACECMSMSLCCSDCRCPGSGVWYSWWSNVIPGTRVELPTHRSDEDEWTFQPVSLRLHTCHWSVSIPPATVYLLIVLNVLHLLHQIQHDEWCGDWGNWTEGMIQWSFGLVFLEQYIHGSFTEFLVALMLLSGWRLVVPFQPLKSRAAAILKCLCLGKIGPVKQNQKQHAFLVIMIAAVFLLYFRRINCSWHYVKFTLTVTAVHIWSTCNLCLGTWQMFSSKFHFFVFLESPVYSKISSSFWLYS